MEMIPIIPGRPPVVTIGSSGTLGKACTIFLSIRDTEYLRQSKRLREDVIARHPDKHPLATPLEQYNLNRSFRKRMRLYQAWKLSQRRSYWLLHLMPPDWKGSPCPPPAHRSTGRKGYKLIEEKA